MSNQLNELFLQALTERMATPEVADKINNAVDKLITDTIEDALGRYSDFGKNARDLIKKSIMPVDDIESFPIYNQFVTDRIRQSVEKFCDERLAKAVDAEMAEIFGEIPNEVTLSWLLDSYKKHLRREAEYGNPLPGHVVLEIERESRSFTKIKIGADYHVSISHVHNDNQDAGEVFHLRVDGRSPDSRDAMRYHGFEKILFNLRAMHAIITLDKGDDPDDYDCEIDFNEDCDDDE